jgi:hypothetical protein
MNSSADFRLILSEKRRIIAIRFGHFGDTTFTAWLLFDLEANSLEGACAGGYVSIVSPGLDCRHVR